MGTQTSKHATTFVPKTMDFGTLESMLQDASVTPICLPVEFLKSITGNFSKEKELGRGAYGVVYKGILQNGKMIAVKKIIEIKLEEDQYQQEVTYLIGIRHENIVQLVGYCAESRWEATEVNGKYVMAEIRKRLLCFEYLPNNSLDKHLSAESCGLEWQMRYDIIKGVCGGLHYLHTECRIVHLDLKPQNILLDDNMLPKLADFGISRLFGQEQSRIITEHRAGTFGYMAPEYITNGVITTKSDMFSLGVIIVELMTGRREYPQSNEMPYENFVKNVIGNWRHRMEKTVPYIEMEICCQQVHRCIVLALKCVNPDPEERPSAGDIIQKLNEVPTVEQPGRAENRMMVVGVILTAAELVQSAASTARQNKKRCLHLAEIVETLTRCLVNFACTELDCLETRVMVRLKDAVVEALGLIQSCQADGIFSRKYSSSKAAELDSVAKRISNCLIDLTLLSQVRGYKLIPPSRE